MVCHLLPFAKVGQYSKQLQRVLTNLEIIKNWGKLSSFQ